MRGGHERVVFDTNVLVSALGFGGRTRRVWELVEEGRCRLFISPFILIELQRNLIGKASLTVEKSDAIERLVLAFATLVQPSMRVDAVERNDSDNRILECALEARADCLVTGNMRDLRRLGAFRGIWIATPREFLDRFG
jgi:uncharacterized protein